MYFSVSRCKVIAWICNGLHLVLVTFVWMEKKQEGNYKETVSFLF